MARSRSRVKKRRSPDVLRVTTRDTMMIRACGPFDTVSRANGLIDVRPRWQDFAPKGGEHTPGGERECACGAMHYGGVATRMWLSDEIARLLNSIYARPPRRAKPAIPKRPRA